MRGKSQQGRELGGWVVGSLLRPGVGRSLPDPFLGGANWTDRSKGDRKGLHNVIIMETIRRKKDGQAQRRPQGSPPFALPYNERTRANPPSKPLLIPHTNTP